MAHYALLNENNIVEEVITGIDETELIQGQTPESWYATFTNKKCVRTSYNGRIRKNYAGIGFYYDELKDAFIPPKPFDSWLLDETICQWTAPKPKPTEGLWYWDENELEWINAKTV